jgi:hypothetical protein
MKNHDFTPNFFFFPILGGARAGCAPPPPPPPPPQSAPENSIYIVEEVIRYGCNCSVNHERQYPHSSTLYRCVLNNICQFETNYVYSINGGGA